MVLVQKWPFFTLFLFFNIGQENVFYDILVQKKNAFLGYKKRSSKMRKIDIFQMGLTDGFVPKMALFPTFFLCNMGQQNVFYDILQQKKRLSRL